MTFQVNGYSFRGSNSATFILHRLSVGSTLTGNNLLLLVEPVWKRFAVQGSRQGDTKLDSSEKVALKHGLPFT